jgi:S1-C subfamily serine protease
MIPYGGSRRVRAAAAAAAVAAVLAACGGSGDGDGAGPRATTAPDSPRGEAPATPQNFAGIPQLVKQLGPSVVAITVTSDSGGQGEGSGVVWDDEDRVVTNNHVIAGASRVAVQTSAGARLEAEVLATDERTDLAVVQVEGGDLPPATFAETLPPVGSLALAMGSPLGFENTVTAGIVSGLDRSLPTGGTEPSLVGLIQTDAAISPGNSGGALVGANGEVVGINVAYLPPQQTGAVSIGFAIPSPTVRDVVGELIDDGAAEHAYLGVRLAPVATGTDSAVAVAVVEPGGPAARAGLQPRDLVVRLDGREVTTIEDVYAVLRSHDPGDEVALVVRRGSDERELTVRLGELPPPAPETLPGGDG